MRIILLLCTVAVAASSALGQPAFDREFVVDTGAVLVRKQHDQVAPAVASDGTDFLVVWTDKADRSLRGARVSAAGVVLDPTGLEIAQDTRWGQGIGDVAFDGTNYLAVWEGQTSGPSGIFASRVTPQGVLLDSGGFVVSNAPLDQLEPAVAFDGLNCLVVWTDERGASYDIYAARVTPDGTVLDPVGIAISRAPGLQQSPAVAFDGACYLVVWADWRSGGTFDVYGARVSRDGIVLDPQGLLISAADGSQRNPAVARLDSGFLVVWEDPRNGNWDVYGSRVTRLGQVLDSAGISVSRATYGQNTPAAAFDGTNVLVTWEDYRSGDVEVYGARVTPQGQVLDSLGIYISQTGSGARPAVAYSDTVFMVAWERDLGYPWMLDVDGTRVSRAGEVLDQSGIPVTRAANGQFNSAAAANGTSYLVAWVDTRDNYRDIYALRLSPDGRGIDTCSFVVTRRGHAQFGPTVCSNGADWLVAWETPDHISGARVGADGTVLDPQGLRIAGGYVRTSGPAVASDGTDYFVVWEGDRGGRWQVLGARVSAGGVVRDSGGFPVLTTQWDRFHPSVAFDGTNFLVVWQDVGANSVSDILGVRVSRDGVVLDSSPIRVSAAVGEQAQPVVAFGGEKHLVVWEDHRSTGSWLFGARVTPDGAVLDPQGIAIGWASWRPFQAVTFDGSSYVVAWLDTRGGERGIYSARVNQDGQVLDSGLVLTRTLFLPSEGSPRVDVTRGPDGQVLLVYEGWAGTVNGRTYSSSRIWGILGPHPGVAETDARAGRSAKPGASIVRSVLHMRPSPSPLPRGEGQEDGAALLDASGRKILDLRPGPNDVRYLPPGVYFIREHSAYSIQYSGSGVRRDASSVERVSKVVLTR